MSDVDDTPVDETKRLEIDLSVYAPLFEDETISDADKMALLEALWSVIMTFAQIGWGVHPVQQAQAARTLRESRCGQHAESGARGGIASLAMIELNETYLSGEFDSAAISRPQKASRP